MGTLFTALGAAAALSNSNIFPVHQGGARALGATGTQLLALVGTAYVPLAGGTMTGALTIASGTLTASAPALNITQTWNGSGVSFRAIDISITNTLSALSYPIVVTVGATNIFYLSSSGDLYSNNLRTTTNSGSYGIGSDTILYRDAAATLAQRNGTNAQTLRIYSTYTSASVYERLSLSTTATSGATIGIESLGATANMNLTLNALGAGQIQFGMGGGSVAAVLPSGQINCNAVKTTALTVATLQAAATAGAGARAFVTDATATTDRSVVAGGGSNKVPVFSDGTNWLIG